MTKYHYQMVDAASLSCRHKRRENQDAGISLMVKEAATDDCVSVHIVFDGVGSMNGLEAAQSAKNAAYSVLGSTLLPQLPVLLRTENEPKRIQMVAAILRELILTCNEAVLGCSELRSASTISAAIILGGYAFTCNYGDSPILLLRSENGEQTMIRMFDCHNRAGSRLEAGEITEEMFLQAKERSELLHGLGIGEIDALDLMMSVEPLGEESVLLVGSDGALSVLSAAETGQLVEQSEDLRAFCGTLYERIAEKSNDNFTVTAVRYRRGNTQEE